MFRLTTLLALLLAPADPSPEAPNLRVAVDSAAREVVLEYRIPAPLGAHHASGHGAHAHHLAHVQRLAQFSWPVTGWARGVSVELESASGTPLPRRVLHHVNLFNLERRQLVHAGIERLWAAGPETASVRLPATVGVRLAAGTRLALLVAFDPAELPEGSRVRVRVSWLPMNMTPRPMDVLPMQLSVNFRPGRTVAYDLPAGPSRRSFEFVVPISGRVLGASGHLHDYGIAIRVEDVETGRTVIELRAERDSLGQIRGMPQQLYGVAGRGRPLRAGRRYRITADYDNTSGRAIPLGAMGEIAAIFAPDRAEEWPLLDLSDPDIAYDLAVLVGYEDR
ncbi:MAG TPA: hypothetical protein VHJ69_10645 [Gemmatimonadales bacterium]|jgi:hypothetical protein|nr:hypothetical protein [Gemmatimonadales bacterium]